ncbi:MAG: cell division protein ZapA [Methylobacteriaceae bacterium]|nr:cell division protein ZapA [Methylobacteriaceae bacterium]
MAHVQVTIAGRPYRMACGDGEEAHLESLAAGVDAKIAELRGNFGEIGDQRITVMAALTYADELFEARKRIAVLEGEVAALNARTADARAAQDAQARDLAGAVAEAAARIERLAAALNGARPEEG